MVGWGRTEAEFRDQESAVRATIDTPDLTLEERWPATLPYRQGVLVFGRNWTFSELERRAVTARPAARRRCGRWSIRQSWRRCTRGGSGTTAGRTGFAPSSRSGSVLCRGDRDCSPCSPDRSVAGPSLTVPNSLTSSVPDDLVWVLVFLLAFCLALFTTAAIHGPWWLATLGLWSLVLLLGVWSAATTTTRGLTLAVVLAVATLLAVVVLLSSAARRGLGWWEFPLVLGLIGLVLTLCALDFARIRTAARVSMAPGLCGPDDEPAVFLVLPAAFAAGAAVAEIAVGLTMAATRAAQRQGHGRWPYVVLAAVVVLRLVQEVRRLSRSRPG